MTISHNALEKIIRNHFPNATIKIEDLVGDEDHYSLEIADAQFDGLSTLKQHRVVKEALKEVLHKDLHSITIKTRVIKAQSCL